MTSEQLAADSRAVRYMTADND